MRLESHRARPAIAAILIVAVAGAAWWASRTWTSTGGGSELVASGTVEADEVAISSEVPGRLTVFTLREGAWVARGDLVGQVDDELIQLQIRQADPVQRGQLERQAERYVIRSPRSGLVLRSVAHEGEVIAVGQVLGTVYNPSELDLIVYVLQRDLVRVTIGQEVEVAADPFPGRTFRGEVMSINQEAEFTPRNVQTARDRLHLVFGVRIRVRNPDAALRPGLPVDARFLGSP